MDETLRARMLAYYNERAPDYEQAYTEGTGTASIDDRRVFTSEAEQLTLVVREFGSGDLLDLACGTGYWLPHYAFRCTHITMIDQSSNMVRECQAKVGALGIAKKTTLVLGDVLEHSFADTYDAVLVGFLVSHLDTEQERQLFDVLRRILRPDGRFLILDSAWTALRARFNVKAGHQVRRLNDGTEFDTYKRYLDAGDIAGWATAHGVTTKIEYFGAALFAVSGRFT
jgi:ubiquinone/menaquinone biosynthesis C-methylase UbiE